MSQPTSSAPDALVERFYYDDTDTPLPNVPILPGASAVIFDSERRILFLKPHSCNRID